MIKGIGLVVLGFVLGAGVLVAAHLSFQDQDSFERYEYTAELLHQRITLQMKHTYQQMQQQLGGLADYMQHDRTIALALSDPEQLTSNAALYDLGTVFLPTMGMDILLICSQDGTILSSGSFAAQAGLQIDFQPTDKPALVRATTKGGKGLYFTAGISMPSSSGQLWLISGIEVDQRHLEFLGANRAKLIMTTADTTVGQLQLPVEKLPEQGAFLYEEKQFFLSRSSVTVQNLEQILVLQPIE